MIKVIISKKQPVISATLLQTHTAKKVQYKFVAGPKGSIPRPNTPHFALHAMQRAQNSECSPLNVDYSSEQDRKHQIKNWIHHYKI